MTCRACEIRAKQKLGMCEPCAERLQAQRARAIQSVEPAPAETFDPQDVLETSLRQARAIQRRLQASIDVASDDDLAMLNAEHSRMASSIRQLVPTWQSLREAEVKAQEKLTPAQEEEAFLFWFGQQPPGKQRELHQRLARVMNGEAA